MPSPTEEAFDKKVEELEPEHRSGQSGIKVMDQTITGVKILNVTQRTVLVYGDD